MSKSLGLAFYITICCIAFVISKIIISILLYKRWKRKHKIHEEGYPGGKMVIFMSSELQSLTSEMVLEKTLKLSNKDMIGCGGYGTVYQLKIDECTAFAVKRLNKGSADRERGFERELEAMADIKHRNVVTLHGYYTSPHYNLLLYELMPNGSLDSFLHEYFDTGRATVKGDVYSFGVVLLELLTGKKPTDETFIEEGTKLVTWVKGVVGEKKEKLVIDKSIEWCSMEEVENVLKVAMMCVEPDPLKRPTMAEVVNLLDQTKSHQLVL
ncbi:receptor-like serine/threonine-protein kinase [Senna tora]|uniref:Receptor-like serine/threonine-protein kinase n=1 Tax=Senna tora TaxID=362788 RepID=A0A834TK41_9FABA|nr:receptor-like serine/threonine-protein kinase [Senna tora]